jgi:hypothetical protein
MANFQPPPTWALPILVDERTQKAIFNPIWLKWFVDLTQVLDAAGGTTPNIHNNLNSIQGGSATQRYHLTQTEHAALTAGFSGTGNIVRATAPTVTSITVSVGTFMVKSSAAFTNGAAAQVGTLNNAPAAGNPTKWIPVDDNGTTRYIPAW